MGELYTGLGEFRMPAWAASRVEESPLLQQMEALWKKESPGGVS
jgi:hypothetical protein